MNFLTRLLPKSKKENKSEAAFVADENDHVREYLKYYLSLPFAPHFAVLVHGPWGVGKTHLIKNFINTQRPTQSGKWLYVSLYGLDNLDQVDEALLFAAFPALGWQASKISARVARSLLKRYGLDDAVKTKDLIAKLRVDA